MNLEMRNSDSGVGEKSVSLLRREFIVAGAAVFGSSLFFPRTADALVRGVAPPADFGKRPAALGKTNMVEAREAGFAKEAELFDKEDGKFQVTAAGDRYRDITVGDGPEVKSGSTVDIRYRVLRLGKRSRDGLSGEASLVFSFGYGEDDDKEGDVVPVVLGPSSSLVPALESAMPGMRQGGTRRIAVRPQRGWKLTDAQCKDSNNSGAAVDIGSALGLPGASVAEAETCLDTTRVPAPQTFQARRKLARRFDESLLVEVQAVKVN